MSTHDHSAEKLPEGYAIATVEWEGYTYELTYYRGFVGSAAIMPDGVTRVDFPIDTSVYVVPQTNPPSTPLKGPDGRSWVKVKGGPNKRAVKFQVDNTPNGHAVSYKGPLAGFQARLNHPSTVAADTVEAAAVATSPNTSAAEGNGAGVTVLEGGNQVASISVMFQPNVVHFKAIAGAARAFDGGTSTTSGTRSTGGGGDEIIIVEDNASICPPQC